MHAKSTLREQVLGRRAQRSRSERAAAGAAFAEALDQVLTRATRVAAYAAVGTEPPTSGILALCRARGIAVLLPLLQPDGDLDWGLMGDDALVPGPHGLPQPAGPPLGLAAVARCDLVVVPALAVDRRGYRLGRGGGSYDRALTRTTARTLALLYDGELVDRLPVDGHDIAVSGVVLPAFGVVDGLTRQ